MTPTTQPSGPMEIREQRSRSLPSLAKRQAKFDQGITLSLFLWPSLSLAVSNHWGGPSSSSKREWFAATLVDLLREEPEADVPWIEQFLLQVMEDEFEVVVDDGSAMETAELLVKLRTMCKRGDFEEVERLGEKWRSRGGDGRQEGLFREVEGEERSTSGSEGEEDSGEENVEMDEAPQLVRTKVPVVREVDEDGFTKVMKKKR